MPLPVSTLGSSALNYSSHHSNTRSATDKCLLRFSNEFLGHTDKVSKWYDQQPSRRFRTIQYRKERTAIAHEFILLLLHGRNGGKVDCHCRVERVGDPQHLAEVICINGTIAEDYIQAIPLDRPNCDSLTHNSDVVAEITFPQTFDLRDVLAICYGISTHFMAKRYTLQQYNCYFFSWTVILGLARACIDWDTSISDPEHLNIIRDRIMLSIIEQGPARFHSIAYILSDKAHTRHEDEQEHPLDQAFRSRMYSPEFAQSLAEAPKRLLWTHRFQLRFIEAIRGQVDQVAKVSSYLLDREQMISGPVKISIMGTKRELELREALGKITQKAIAVASERGLRLQPQSLFLYSPVCVLFKQRIGNKAWCKSLAHCMRHPENFFFATDESPILNNESPNSHHQPTHSPAHDLCFVPVSATLDICARLGITCGLTLGMLLRRMECTSKGHRALDKNGFRSTALRVGTAVQYAGLEIASMPRYFSISKHMLLVHVAKHATNELDPASRDDLELPLANIKLMTIASEGLNDAISLLSTGLRRLIKDAEEHQINVLRPCVRDAVKAILEVVSSDLADGWELILQQEFLGIMARAAENELKGRIDKADIEGLFQVFINSDHALFRVPILDANSSKFDGVIEGSSHGVTSPHETRHRMTQSPDSLWSYQRLQAYIRGRIRQLSKRENSFAPYLKHLQFAKSAEVCQREIEATIEGIWRTSAPLIQA